MNKLLFFQEIGKGGGSTGLLLDLFESWGKLHQGSFWWSLLVGERRRKTLCNDLASAVEPYCQAGDVIFTGKVC